MNFLEKSWTFFMWILYIEWIMKDLIILKKNPQLVIELNQNILSEELTKKREEYARAPFSIYILKEFFEIFNLDTTKWNTPFQIIRISRNIYWHSRISVNENCLWHTPDTNKVEGFESRLAEIKYYFNIEWEWNSMKIDDANFHFEEKIAMIESLDKEFFPSLAKNIWLNYERIR